jgi:predicted nucleotide-binding protein
VENFGNREQALTLLMTQSESQLEAFFFALGLAADFQGPPAGWGRQKRIVSALMAAEQRGDLERVLDLIHDRFAPASRTPLDSSSVARPRPVQSLGPDETRSEVRPAGDPKRSGRARVPDSVTSVFIVHGRDAGLREQAARLVERVGNGALEAVVLAERPNGGQVLLDKFEHYASAAGFAIALLTADDVGGPAGGGTPSRARARENVILELGFFLGILGRGRVVVLLDERVQLPSDLNGIVYISVDSAGAWKHALVRDMLNAGLPVDFSRIV